MLGLTQGVDMTTPTIVITLDGGLIQDITVTHQVRVIVLDRDTEGSDKADLSVITDRPSWVHVESPMPNDLGRRWIDNVLLDIERDRRP